MKLQSLGSKDRLNRRDFLRIPRPKDTGIPLVDKEKCTGCGLCTIDCPTKALSISQHGERDPYQLLLRQELCNACGLCEKSCPEHCLRLVEKEPGQDQIRREAQIIFEDEMSKCAECGISLFPQAMVKKLEHRIFNGEKSGWPINLCPPCRMKTQFEKEKSSFSPLYERGK
jgi:ferredoxin